MKRKKYYKAGDKIIITKEHVNKDGSSFNHVGLGGMVHHMTQYTDENGDPLYAIKVGSISDVYFLYKCDEFKLRKED